MQTLRIGYHYSFSVYANAVLGSSFKNQRLVSVLDYQSALREDNIPLQHRQIYPFLPEGTPNDATKYTYYKFRDADGRERVFADVWLQEQTVEQTNGVDQTVILRNVTTSQCVVVRDQLRLLGISFDFV